MLLHLKKAIAANVLPRSMLDSEAPSAAVRQNFRRYVKVVEIENHNYCNRVCSFCPNAWLDRRSDVVLMTDELWYKILDNLASIEYQGALVWSRYHEPMAHDSFFTRILEARQRLPHAQLIVISNADYLDRAKLAILEQASVNETAFDIYLPEGQERDAAKVQATLDKFTQRSGLTLRETQPWEYVAEGSTIPIKVGVPVYSVDDDNLSTRGGLLDIPALRDYQRTAVCFNPVHSVVVDYNGAGMMCCQVRSDAPSQRDAIIGDLSHPDYDLFDLYRDMAKVRDPLVRPGPKQGACTTCTVSDQGPNLMARNDLLAGVVDIIPGARSTVNALIDRRNKRRIG